jgi:hypothetical protein
MTETSSATGTPVSSEGTIEIAPIEQRLRCRLGHRVHDLRIWVEPHGLIITGCTSSYYDKQMAQHLVREMSGLGVADNRIVVDSRLAEPIVGQPDEFQRDQFGHGHAGRYRRPHIGITFRGRSFDKE